MLFMMLFEVGNSFIADKKVDLEVGCWMAKIYFVTVSLLHSSFSSKRLPQQNVDRRIGERGTCMCLIVCGLKVGARALPSPHTR